MFCLYSVPLPILTLFLSQPLTVAQIKKVQTMIGEASERAKMKMKDTEEERHKHLVMIGNVLHASVPVSNNEVGIYYDVSAKERE